MPVGAARAIAIVPACCDKIDTLDRVWAWRACSLPCARSDAAANARQPRRSDAMRVATSSSARAYFSELDGASARVISAMLDSSSVSRSVSPTSDVACQCCALEYSIAASRAPIPLLIPPPLARSSAPPPAPVPGSAIDRTSSPWRPKLTAPRARARVRRMSARRCSSAALAADASTWAASAALRHAEGLIPLSESS